MIFLNATTNSAVKKKIMQAKKTSNIYPVQTTGGWKLPMLNFICFLLNLFNFESFSGASLTCLNNQEIQDGGSKMAVRTS